MTVATLPDVLRAVESAWVARPERDVSWPAPHPDRAPLDEEYSRVTDPERYLVVGARVQAWVEALTSLGLARRSEGPEGVLRLVPAADGALVLDVAVRSINGVSGTVVDLLVGDPAVVVGTQPDCGCDACDDGSESLREAVDEMFVGTLGGGFVLIDSKRSTIIATADGWSASGNTGDTEAAVAAARRGERRRGRRTLVGAAWWVR
ncbi:hypothetical protein EDF31_101105 [Curtobacterium sp. PhB142]|uniref:DUF6226 family protein n=1 Tax=unclassified Curtobacterium TaxID=257496 RepID=UPI001046AEBD|nr:MULTISPECIES: DUF6226 family protein [unclassified Curtobacterium]TCL88265.1 hypothetical protein EDF31_101105 [Curtobacterium sp. PhB142]TCM00065.1 hypothetical protein EDF26_1106 [Curtobacterium sp. PhB134]